MLVGVIGKVDAEGCGCFRLPGPHSLFNGSSRGFVVACECVCTKYVLNGSSGGFVAYECVCQGDYYTSVFILAMSRLFLLCAISDRLVCCGSTRSSGVFDAPTRRLWAERASCVCQIDGEIILR